MGFVSRLISAGELSFTLSPEGVRDIPHFSPNSRSSQFRVSTAPFLFLPGVTQLNASEALLSIKNHSRVVGSFVYLYCTLG